jgi:hypothetical protein
LNLVFSAILSLFPTNPYTANVYQLMGDEKKPASDVELQVPNNEGERECKKPRLSGSFLVPRTGRS